MATVSTDLVSSGGRWCGALADEGIDTFRLPVSSLAAVVVLAAISST